MANWTFLSNHAQVLLSIAHDPGIRLRDIGDQVGITERAAHRHRQRPDGCRLPLARAQKGVATTTRSTPICSLPDPLAREQRLGDLLSALAG